MSNKTISKQSDEREYAFLLESAQAVVNLGHDQASVQALETLTNKASQQQAIEKARDELQASASFGRLMTMLKVVNDLHYDTLLEPNAIGRYLNEMGRTSSRTTHCSSRRTACTRCCRVKKPVFYTNYDEWGYYSQPSQCIIDENRADAICERCVKSNSECLLPKRRIDQVRSLLLLSCEFSTIWLCT